MGFKNLHAKEEMFKTYYRYLIFGHKLYKLLHKNIYTHRLLTELPIICIIFLGRITYLLIMGNALKKYLASPLCELIS